MIQLETYKGNRQNLFSTVSDPQNIHNPALLPQVGPSERLNTHASPTNQAAGAKQTVKQKHDLASTCAEVQGSQCVRYSCNTSYQIAAENGIPVDTQTAERSERPKFTQQPRSNCDSTRIAELM